MSFRSLTLVHILRAARSRSSKWVTRFTFDNGVAVNVMEYTFAPGDTDGTRRVDPRDVAAFQTCFGTEVFSGPCQACDFHGSGRIRLTDFAEFRNGLMGS